MKIAYVSYAVAGRENYPAGIPRLAASWTEHCPTARGHVYTSGVVPAEVECFSGSVPSHAEVPYGFKPAMVAGVDADIIVWCDATIQLVGDPTPLFEKALQQGVVAFNNPGCPEATWTTDDCLAKIGCPVERARTFSQVMACVLIFAPKTEVGGRLLKEWLDISRDGVSFCGGTQSFNRPDYRDHRHDQSVISWLLERDGIAREPYGALTYWDDRSTSTVYTNRGLYQP